MFVLGAFMDSGTIVVSLVLARNHPAVSLTWFCDVLFFALFRLMLESMFPFNV